MSRYLTVGLLAALAVLGVAFTVIMGFYLLIQQLGDDASVLVLGWAGGACLVLLVITFVLLVISLALDSIAPRDPSEPSD
jgi:TRAP-type C4-dicarboxylate transport system permease large subunit